MRTDTKKSHIHRQRQGNHQKRTGKFLKVYSPYLPLILLTVASIYLSIRPAQGQTAQLPTKNNTPSVLAYATDISVSGLLGSTNQQRNGSGVGSLSVNSKLNNAAQAKANDMVTRDYWSHNTPDGSLPWVFITNAGYSYSRAGENLAYGYSTSVKTIEGWMGSPTHKANLLDGNFSEVGFGIANASNFIGSPDDREAYPGVGNQTIVVAMYATPYTAPSQAAPTKPSTVTPTKPAPAPSTAPTTPAPQPEVPTVTQNNDTTKNEQNTEKAVEPVITANNTEAKVLSDDSTVFNRLQSITGSSLPWLGSLLFVLSLSGAMIVLGKHGYAFHNFVLKGERYVLQHTLFDLTVISLIAFTYIVTRGAGVIL